MSGRIPRPFIDDLLNRVDIVDVVDARVPLKKQGSNWVACCPFHDEKTPSFSVSPNKQFYYCFGCGASGSAIGFLMEYDRLDFVEAVEALAGTLGIEVPREGGVAHEGHDALLRVLGEADTLYQKSLRDTPTAIEYLKQRGLSGRTAARYGLGWAPASYTTLLDHFPDAEREHLMQAGLINRKEETGRLYDRFRGRIMFPIRDRRGRTIAFGGRVLDDAIPKYLNSPETPVFHKGRELYGLYEARRSQRNPERLLVVEGYMDVIMLAEHGVSNAVATLGTSVSEDHIERLFASAAEIVFCFDGDNAGRQAAGRALTHVLPQLRDGREVRFLFLPEGEDPDSMVQQEGRNAFSARVADATPLADFLLDRIRSTVDTSTEGGRARLAAEARPLLARMPQGVYRDLLIHRLAAEVGLSADLLRADIARGPDPGQASTSAPPKPVQKPSAVRMNALRTAIALLLQHPALAERIPKEHPALQTAETGTAILQSLCDQIQANPQATTAQLLEAWRDTSELPHLQRLAGHEFVLDSAVPQDKALARLLDDTLARLTQKHYQARYDALLAASRERSLTAEEKANLRSLAEQLH